MFDLTKKTAIVTGGGSGIGRSIALCFARQGAKVMVADLDAEAANKVSEEIENSGGDAEAYHLDVTSQEVVRQTFEEISDRNGIDILINNAGIAHIGNIENTSSSDLDRVYDVNVRGVYNCAQAAISFMKNAGGVILNMASIASVVGINDRFAYSMSKGAVLTMTLSIAKDYLSAGIRCNCIAPARVHTPFVDGFIAKNYPDNQQEMFEKLSATQPIGRMGTPEEIAALALYLCSDEASFITGSCYPIDGGFVTLNG